MDIQDTEFNQQVVNQIALNKRLYQLCSLLITHLSRYEDTTRFDNTLLDIITRISETPFQDNVKKSHDPTALI